KKRYGQQKANNSRPEPSGPSRRKVHSRADDCDRVVRVMPTCILPILLRQPEAGVARSLSAQGRARRHNGRQVFMKTLQELLDLRFGDIGAVPETLAGNEAIRRLASRGVIRRFKPEPLPAAVLDTLAAVALSSPSKSDLQQRDILIVEDAAIRARINA